MKAELFQELLESVREAGAILRGEKEPSRAFRFEELDIKAIRRRYEMSQVKLASLLGVSKRTLEGWEQGRRKPHGPPRAGCSKSPTDIRKLCWIQSMKVHDYL